MGSKKTIIHKEVTGKIIGISEENKENILTILINNFDIEIKTKNQKYMLGERIEINIDLKLINTGEKKHTNQFTQK